MNELERSAGNASQWQHLRTPTDQRALFDRFGAMAYGVILQILPQTHLAQEALLDVFTSLSLSSFSTSSTSPALAIIRLARLKALERKARTSEPDAASAEPSSSAGRFSPEFIFDLSFRQGYSFDAISEQLDISKPEILKAVRNYIHLFRRS
ncbi:hypothetical protein LX87_01271 [Larkinella arboricola]|uniref:Uncharacterized protein n=1 Tax=Larkinella arboricola TaxID=643671 RepID=A0A327X8W6_LARAB|nr:hypothetical protein [Larkinella arboricola]RAK03149.1 hypothetical protein LX87_01271 [Larkinella arboricola]